MKRGRIVLSALAVAGALGAVASMEPEASPEPTAGWTVLAWNDLGMHCMDEDFSVFAILPPFNTINAQLIDANGVLVEGDSGITLTYEAAMDPAGSASPEAATQTNFWAHARALFGVDLPAGTGLAGYQVPGANNTPQPMHWNDTRRWWTAEGIPIVPIDMYGDPQNYPLLRVRARDPNGRLLAETTTPTPVSTEMNCRNCHGSASGPQAKPPGGWVNDSDAIRDYRLNILRLHDQTEGQRPTFTAALAALAMHSEGLEATVRQMDRPILCASCHGSNALGTAGQPGVPPLTQAMHARHSTASDPETGVSLGASTNRLSCYQCHPGIDTRCLRDAMGNAVDANGQASISCQSCHGGMSSVGALGRTGWLQEPNCQSCHTGTETLHTGPAIRYIRNLSSFLDSGQVRQPADTRFATNPDTPAAGVSLYRFSSGHGGLQCAACHGSPHATYPTNETNDNLQSLALQGHVGTIGDCTACHVPAQEDEDPINTSSGGPHGLHVIGQWWVNNHGDVLESGTATVDGCRACHGKTDRGGVLSRALGQRSLAGKDGRQVAFFEGQTVSCYECHDGPDSDDLPTTARPVVQSFRLTTNTDATMTAVLRGNDPDSPTLIYRIIQQPRRGVLSMAGSSIAYTPAPGFHGTDHFTYCASDEFTESNLGVVSIDVGAAAGQADADGDGLPDLLERALGLPPERPSRGGYSRISLVEEDGQLFLQAMYDARLTPPDVQLAVQISHNLTDWTDNDPLLTHHVNSQGMSVVRYSIPINGGTCEFMRFAVFRK